MDSELARIAWRSNVTGFTGHGECLPRKTAEAALEVLKKEWGTKALEHWLEPCRQGIAQSETRAAYPSSDTHHRSTSVPSLYWHGVLLPAKATHWMPLPEPPQDSDLAAAKRSIAEAEAEGFDKLTTLDELLAKLEDGGGRER